MAGCSSLNLEKKRKAMHMKSIRKGVFVLSLVLILVGLGMAFQYWMNGRANQKAHVALQDIRTGQVEETVSAANRELQSRVIEPESALLGQMQVERDEWMVSDNSHYDFLEMNPDYVGWIKIDDTLVDYPIVRAADNDYYLDRDFQRQKNKAGAIFMDYRNIGNGDDPHTLIYGHNMRDQSMFHNLRKFRDKQFFADHEYITVDYLFGAVRYQVFAAYLTTAADVILDIRFDEKTFPEFDATARREAELYREVKLQASDQILTLATCAYDFEDARLIVHARRVDEGIVSWATENQFSR